MHQSRFWRTLAVTSLSTVALLATVPLLAEAVTGNVTVSQSIAASIAITAPSAITMTPLSVTQNTAVSMGAWVVTTNDVNGYNLTLNASTNPAMKNGGTSSFADYATATPSTWSVTNAYKFGFTAYGPDTTGWSSSNCTTTPDVPAAAAKWSGFYGATGFQIASTTAATAFTGNTTTMCIADAQNGVFAPSGSYSATITATATAL